MNQIVLEKSRQAIEILKEKKLDMWLIFVRETTATRDPVLPLIYGLDLTWQSALIFTAKEERIAIVGHLEAEAARQTGVFDEILPYHQSIREVLVQTLYRLAPSQIGVNFSKNDVHADGLGHGLFLLLKDYLSGTPFESRLVSAEAVSGALRSRKTPTEVHLIRQAVQISEKIFAKTFEFASLGCTEKEVGAFMQTQVQNLGLELAWESLDRH